MAGGGAGDSRTREAKPTRNTPTAMKPTAHSFSNTTLPSAMAFSGAGFKSFGTTPTAPAAGGFAAFGTPAAATARGGLGQLGLAAGAATAAKPAAVGGFAGFAAPKPNPVAGGFGRLQGFAAPQSAAATTFPGVVGAAGSTMQPGLAQQQSTLVQQQQQQVQAQQLAQQQQMLLQQKLLRGRGRLTYAEMIKLDTSGQLKSTVETMHVGIKAMGQIAADITPGQRDDGPIRTLHASEAELNGSALALDNAQAEQKLAIAAMERLSKERLVLGDGAVGGGLGERAQEQKQTGKERMVVVGGHVEGEGKCRGRPLT